MYNNCLFFVNQPGYYSFNVSAKSLTDVITYFNFAVSAKAAKGDELPFKTRCWVSTGEPVMQWHCAVLIEFHFGGFSLQIHTLN